MAEGFSVDTEELAQCGRRVAAMSSQAESLHGRATAAEVPSRSWGLLGELTTHSKYADMQNQLTDHLSKMTTGVDNAGQRISNTADLYRETDEYHKKRIGEAGGDQGKNEPGTGDPGRSGGPGSATPVDGGGPRGHDTAPPDIPGGDGRSPGGAGRYAPVEHGGARPVDGGPAAGDGGPVASGSVTSGPVPGGPVPGGPVPGGPIGTGSHPLGKITIEVAGGGPVTVEVTGEAKEDVEVKGDIQQSGGQTEHVDVHAQTDAAGHAKVAMNDPAYQHMSGTLLPDTAEEQA